MPNWCSNAIRIDFAEKEHLEKFVSSFESYLFRIDSKTGETIYKKEKEDKYCYDDFFYENKEKDIGICLFDITYSVDYEELYFEIENCRTKWNFHGEKLDAFFEFMSKFHFEECIIKYAECGCDFFGSIMIVPDNSTANETTEILDTLLKNNDKNLIEKITDYLPTYQIIDDLEVEGVYDEIDWQPLEDMEREELEKLCKEFELEFTEETTEEELINLLEENGYDEYEERDRKLEEWFTELGYEEYYGLWCSSG